MVNIMGKFIDLTGQKFGRLTVVKRGENYTYYNSKRKVIIPQWYCKCNCGNPELILVRGLHLRNGNTKSCGCLSKDFASNLNKKHNTYDLSGEYGIGYTSKGEEFYFDLEDYDLIKDYCWFILDNGYVCTNKNNKSILMHRLIMEPDNNSVQIDHVFHRKNDNRKSQLRAVTRSQNNMNMTLRKDNKSAVTGVTYKKDSGLWVAQIQINNIPIYLGSFNKFEDAVTVRKDAEKKYFGEYAFKEAERYDN